MLSLTFVARGATEALDRGTTSDLQSVASFPLDVLANANTVLGQPIVTLVLTAVLFAALWRGYGLVAASAALLIAIPAFGGLAVKLAVEHAPPPAELTRALWNPLGTPSPTTNGFPSGHLARVAFLATLAFGAYASIAARVALAALLAYTFWARIYIGDHWLSDAVGGLALGVATGCLAVAWLLRPRGRAAQTPA